MKRNSEIYVFDMDDTLVDSHRRYEEGIFVVLDEEGIPYEPTPMKSVLNPLGYARTAELYCRMGVPGTPDEVLERILGHVKRYYCGNTPLLPGVQDCLRTLKERGKRLFVLTATPRWLAVPCLENVGISPLFERIWSTEEFGLQKDNSLLYDQLAAAIGCKKQDIVFVDDGVTAMRTARAAGVVTCGFINPLAMENAAMEQAAEYTFSHYEELL